MTKDDVLAELKSRGVDPNNPPVQDSSSGLTKDQVAQELQSRGIKLPDQGEGAGMSFLRGMENQMPLGAQFSALVSPGKYSDNMQAQNDAIAQDKQNHPVAYDAGAVSGAVAPALVPGVGEAMVANPATTGAIMGGTNAVSNTDVTKQPAIQTAQEAGTGASVGALLNGLMAKIAPPTQSALESKSNTLANKSVNMPKDVLVNMTPGEQQSLGSTMRNNGIVTANKQEALTRAKGLLQTYGQKIGSIGDDMTKQGLTVDDPGTLTQSLMDQASRFQNIQDDPEADKLYKGYLAGAKAIAGLGDNPTWTQIQGLKQDFGKLAFDNSGQVKNQASADVYSTLSNALKGIAEKAQNNPNLPTEYKQALTGYSQMSPVVDGLKTTVDTELRGAGGAGMGFHPMRMLASMPGPVRAIGGATALATGHPILAVAAGLPEAMNPAIQSNVLGGLSKATPSITNAIGQLLTKGSTNQATQQKIQDLISQLKAKYNQGQ